MGELERVVLPAAVAASVWAVCCGHVNAQCDYEAVTVEPISCGGFEQSPIGRAINDLGHVCGSYGCVFGDRAFIWTRGSEITTLPLPQGYSGAEALDINNNGQVVGWMQVDSTNRQTAALWHDGGVLDLGTLPGGNWSVAAAINNRGIIVGTWGNSTTGDPARSVFVWDQGKMADLGPLISEDSSTAHDVNDAGDIVGSMGPSAVQRMAFLFRDGQVLDLGPVPGGSTSEAQAINNRGEIIGYGFVENFMRRAFVWSDGEMIDIGTLPTYTTFFGLDINEAGQIVGVARGDGVPDAAFLWQQGVMYELDDLVIPDGSVLATSAWGINDSGQVTGAAIQLGSDVPVGHLMPGSSSLGDLNVDCDVNVTDLLRLLSEWGQADSIADIDQDGTVGTRDLLMLLSNWG